jgi:adenylate kinase
MHAQTVLSLYKPAQDLLLLDGIPRTVAQAKALEKYLDVLLVLHLICPNEDEMVRRMRRRALKENRIDDADEKVIRRRFEVYERETRPVLACYPESIIREVDAIGSPANVLQKVLEVVVPVQDAHFKNPLGAV